MSERRYETVEDVREGLSDLAAWGNDDQWLEGWDTSNIHAEDKASFSFALDGRRWLVTLSQIAPEPTP